MFFSPKKDISTLSDAELISAYLKKEDTYYIGALFTRYSHLISALAYKYLKNEEDTEDAVMDIFEITIADLKTTPVQNFSAWVYSVTKNYCLKYKRKATVKEQETEVLKKNPDYFMELGSQNALMDEDWKEGKLKGLEEALGKLKEEQKRCVVLFYLEGKSYQEVADETGFELKKVKSYIQNGKRNIQLQLENKK